MSAERFARLGKRVTISIHFGGNFSYGNDAPKWLINVKFKDDVLIEVEEKAEDLNSGLARAYNRLDAVASKGLPSGAMLPSIEHQPPALTDDEIPF